MRTWVCFADLQPGDIFRFVYNPLLRPTVSDEYFVREGQPGWYRKLNDPQARVWRTGPSTAVTVVSARVRRLTCCCCDGDAPAREQ
jgi:hypothetical protein